MTDAPTPTPAPDAATAPTPQPDALADAGKKALQDERKSRRDAENALKTLQAEHDALKAQSMSDAEKLVAERVKDATSPLQSENLRLRVALSKGLPADLVDRLKGDTQEEIEADADALLALFTKQEEPKDEGPPPFPDLGQGQRGDQSPPLGSDQLVNSLKRIVGAQ